MHNTSVSNMSLLVSCWNKLWKKYLFSFYFSPTRTQAVEGTPSVTETSDKGNATNIKTTSDKHCQRYVWEIYFVIANNDIVCKSIMRQSTLPLYLYILDNLRVDKYNFK